MKHLLPTVFVALSVIIIAPLTAESSVSRAGETSPQLLLDRALSAYHERDFNRAAVHFEKYIELVGDREVALRYLARIALERNNFSKAEAYLSRAVQADARAMDSLLLLAEIYLKQNKFKPAVAVLEKALAVDPFQERALSALGYIWQQSDARKAAAVYKRLILAVQKGSNSPELFFQAYSFLGNYYYQQSDYQKAVFYYTKVVELDNTNIRNLMVLGELHKIAGDFRSSVEVLERLLRLKADYLPALESITESLFVLGDARLAHYCALLENTPKAKEPLMAAIRLFIQGDIAASEGQFNAVLQENPNRLSVHVGLARLAARKGDRKLEKNEAFATVVLAQRIGAWEIAREFATPVFSIMAEDSEKLNFFPRFFDELNAAKLDGEIEQQALDYAELYSTHATTLENLDMKKLAAVYYLHAYRYTDRLEQWYDSYLKLHPKEAAVLEHKNNVRRKSYQILVNKAWVSQSVQRPEVAIKDLDLAISLMPDAATAQFLKGAILYSMGEKHSEVYPKALEIITQALALAEENTKKNAQQNRVPANYYFYHGMALEKNGNFAQAEVSFKKAIELEPYNPTYLNYLGYMYSLRNEKLTEAHDLLLKALEDDPENEAYLDSYGWILFRMGQPKAALEQLILAHNFASKKNITDAVIFFHLAEVYFELKDYSLAHFYYSKTLEFIDKSSEKIDRQYLIDKLKELEVLKNQ